VAVDDTTRAAWNDAEEATEWAAVGVAISVARRVLGRDVFLRLPKGTGADFLMRDPANDPADGLAERYERLECSGIGDGKESSATRLRKKDRQLERARHELPGVAIVTTFRADPVHIEVGSPRR
jgi:hypothetical protein